MITVLKPLSKVVVAESTSSLIKPGAVGFVVLCGSDGFGYQNYWAIDLIITRNGKRGQRRIAYKRARTKKIEYGDLFKPEVIELMNQKSMWIDYGYEPSGYKRNEYVILEKDPYKSRNLLDWDLWDFLGWLGAASQLCYYMENIRDTRKRLSDGFPLIDNPPLAEGVLQLNPESDFIDILSIPPANLLSFLIHTTTSTKNNRSIITEAFNRKELRLALIETYRRSISYGYKAYEAIVNTTQNIHDEFLAILLKDVANMQNPDKNLGKEKKTNDIGSIPLPKYKRSITNRIFTDTVIAQPEAPEPTLVNVAQMLEEDQDPLTDLLINEHDDVVNSTPGGGSNADNS